MPDRRSARRESPDGLCDRSAPGQSGTIRPAMVHRLTRLTGSFDLRHFSVVVIPLERGPGAAPVHRQLVGYLRRAIESGRMPAGARLPPIRDLAAPLGVHRETVAGAYRQLAALGLTESRIGRRTFVRAVPRPPAPGGAGRQPAGG